MCVWGSYCAAACAVNALVTGDRRCRSVALPRDHSAAGQCRHGVRGICTQSAALDSRRTHTARCRHHAQCSHRCGVCCLVHSLRHWTVRRYDVALYTCMTHGALEAAGYASRFWIPTPCPSPTTLTRSPSCSLQRWLPPRVVVYVYGPHRTSLGVGFSAKNVQLLEAMLCVKRRAVCRCCAVFLCVGVCL